MFNTLCSGTYKVIHDYDRYSKICKFVRMYVYIYMCIYIYIYYANMSYIQCEGYITFEDTKQVSSIQYIGPISILYFMMVTSPA